jgi:hypothetical protein
MRSGPKSAVLIYGYRRAAILRLPRMSAVEKGLAMDPNPPGESGEQELTMSGCTARLGRLGRDVLEQEPSMLGAKSWSL